MTRPKERNKPEPPYPDFPLYAHGSGQYARRINGTVHYFGSWSKGWQAALEKYVTERDALYAGLTVEPQGSALRDILNSFRRSKKLDMERGKITARSFREYEAVCDKIAETINKLRPMESITQDELGQLGTTLTTGKKGQTVSPTSAKRILSMARSVFYHANEECGCTVRYKKPLASPSAKQLRKARNETGERLFTAKQINDLLAIASPQIKAMILLGINCGFGNRDCATLPIEQVDLATGWHTYWRPKTENPRRAPLWPETAAALYAVIKDRKSGYVFITRTGKPWYSDDKLQCPITYEFRKLLRKLKCYEPGITTFYSLRRTFQTVGELAGEPKALQFIMGHTPATDDMSAVYRQKHWDAPLLKVADTVHKWLFKP
jgi:integrase